MKQQFIVHRFNYASRLTIDTISGIIDAYAAQGYRLSVRQVYYQLVAKALIANNKKSYMQIQTLISNARLAGYIDWNMIEDRNRETVTPPLWNSPAEIVNAAAQQFAIDRWADQDYHLEVMVEKAALEGVLLPVCMQNGIRFTANRGYSSQSLLYETGQRLRRKLDEGKNVIVFYLGDHDPSGIDMTRDVLDRLTMFTADEITLEGEVLDSNIQVERLALNIDQVRKWQPPENPAKTTDSRYAQYIRLYGTSSWELDAIEPATLGELVNVAISKYRDDDLYNNALAKEAKMRTDLETFASTYKAS